MGKDGRGNSRIGYPEGPPMPFQDKWILQQHLPAKVTGGWEWHGQFYLKEEYILAGWTTGGLVGVKAKGRAICQRWEMMMM